MDGRVLVAGNFTAINGISRSYIARLNADGTIDDAFIPGTGANGSIFSVVVQADGKVLVGGNFTLINETSRNSIARLNADGSLDRTFDPGSQSADYVQCIVVQADGKILVGGFFSTFGGASRNSVARLHQFAWRNQSLHQSNHRHAAILPAEGELISSASHFVSEPHARRDNKINNRAETKGKL